MKATTATSKSFSRTANGFTLVEILVVIAIIVTLMAIAVPVTRGAMLKAQKTKAKQHLTEAVQGVGLYYNAYNILPADSSTPPSEDAEMKTDSDIMSVLAGFNIDDMNKKEQNFVNVQEAKGSSSSSAVGGMWRDKNGAELYDVWRKPPGGERAYILLLDYDYDQKLDDPFRSGRVVAQQVVGWSTGRDGKVRRGTVGGDENEDNVYSWFGN